MAAELERRWELALHAVAEAREAAERFAREPPAPQLTPELQAQVRAVGACLPELGVSCPLTQQKALLRSLIRHIIVTRPMPDTIEAKVVWVSGAVTGLTVHPPMLRDADVTGYAVLVARGLAVGAAGNHDREIAQRLTEEGVRSARSARVPTAMVGEIRRARGQRSISEQCKTQAKLEGHWTVFGLAQELAVHRNWLDARIRNGRLPATRQPLTGQDLIPDKPELLTRLRAQRERCCYR